MANLNNRKINRKGDSSGHAQFHIFSEVVSGVHKSPWPSFDCRLLLFTLYKITESHTHHVNLTSQKIHVTSMILGLFSYPGSWFCVFDKSEKRLFNYAPNKSSPMTSMFRFWNCGHFGISCISLKSLLLKQHRSMWNREGGSWVKKLAATVETSNGKFHSTLRGNVTINFIINDLLTGLLGPY